MRIEPHWPAVYGGRTRQGRSGACNGEPHERRAGKALKQLGPHWPNSLVGLALLSTMMWLGQIRRSPPLYCPHETLYVFLRTY